METLHHLVRVVARSFYDDKQIVILDTIVRETMVPEDFLIDRMQIVIRDLNRILAHLVKDRLIKCETRQQPRADGKIINRNFFYIDYKQFVDVVKYRIFKMRQSVEEMIKKEMESKGYICSQCKTMYSSLDVSRLLNVRTGSFDCEICPNSELQTCDQGIANGKTAPGPHELHSRLMEQTRIIVELLKKADDISIPVFIPTAWLEKNASKYSLLTLETDGDDGPQLAVAGANSLETKMSVSVELAEEGSVNSTTASVSTPLPEWHMYSTVTGEAIRNNSNTTDHVGNTPSLPIKSKGDASNITDTEQEEFVSYYSQMVEDGAEEPSPKIQKLHVDEESSVQEPSTGKVLIVTVAGKPVNLDQLTEEDKDNMTEEEYAQYYEIYMSTLQ